MELTPLDQLTYADFADPLNTRYRVWVAAGDAVEFELVEVTPRRIIRTSGAKPAAYESFALHFLGPADRLLVQRIYCFDSEALGRFELFIVPVGRDQQGIRYEAAFNRQVTES